MPASLMADTDVLLAEDGLRLVAAIEEYLAGVASRRTAHPLVSKPTAELVQEALGAQPAAGPAPQLRVPGRLAGLLPDWALPGLRGRHGAGRQVGVVEHLELTGLLIERHGWAQGRLRSWQGGRCILGAQMVLYRLGYGDEATAVAAGRRIQVVLAGRGIDQPFHEWQDRGGRTEAEVLCLIRQAAADARS
ncbi:hypothetical protein ACFY97_18745 [Streptomyces klenkii]|uniref:DUF6197 family protein n=1 Tax=Streptomyces klenkii TaxID=1420899 RepID=UPI0036EE6CB0